jgi:hypothetical protein
MEVIIYNQGGNASSDFDQMHNMMKASIFISSAFIKKFTIIFKNTILFDFELLVIELYIL